jgi:flagellar protein FlaG
MELRIGEIQSALNGAWVTPEQRQSEGSSIPPVTKVEGGSAQSANMQQNGSTEQNFNSSPKEAKETTQAIQSYLDDLNITLNFELEEDTGQMIVSVKNRETGDVIRQIPPETLVELRKRLEDLRGVLYDNKA